MAERDFKTREELMEWAENLTEADHEAGIPAPEMDAQPGDVVVLEFESDG